MSSCANCKLRQHYDTNPKSLLGRIWRWHINICPGWKGYVRSLPEAEKAELFKKYDIPS